MRCCPKEPARKVPRSIYEEARDVTRACAKADDYAQSRRDRKKFEMLFAHLKRILRLHRLRLPGPEWRPVRIHPRGHRTKLAAARQAGCTAAAR
jgi:hypothetical protein